MKRLFGILTTACVLFSLSSPAFAGFNADAPKPVRRIFTQLAFAEGRLVTYHVLEPGPQAIQAFPTGHNKGMILRFPGCPSLRPVLDDTAAPSPQNSLTPDQAMREVFNVTLKSCVQPTSVSEAFNKANSKSSIGMINAPSVPAPVGANVPEEEQQTADELWGPVPNVGVVDFFAGGNLSPQNVLATTLSGLAVADVQQLDVRRPRIKGYSAGKVVYFITYETRDLSRVGLVSSVLEDQWSRTGFPGERPLWFLAYGRAPLPSNNEAVINLVKGAPFWNEGDYSPLWKMSCLDGGITPPIGPGSPCGNTRYSQIGQPRFVSEVNETGLPLVNGIFRDINCPILGTDVNDDGTFANTSLSKEVVGFPDIDWDNDGNPEDGISDPDSTLN